MKRKIFLNVFPSFSNLFCLFFWSFCLSNRKFERLGDPLDEIVTISVHKYSIIMSRPSMMWWRHLIREIRCQDVGCFIRFLSKSISYNHFLFQAFCAPWCCTKDYLSEQWKAKTPAAFATLLALAVAPMSEPLTLQGLRLGPTSGLIFYLTGITRGLSIRI